MELLESDPNNAFKSIISDKLHNFIQDKESVNEAVSWIEQGYIHPEGDKKKSLFDLVETQSKTSLLNSVCQSKHVTFEKKNQLLQIIFGNQKGDKANLAKLNCFAALPDAASKENTWNEIINPQSKLSDKEKEAQIFEFNVADQGDILKPYHEKFFNSLIQVQK